MTRLKTLAGEYTLNSISPFEGPEPIPQDSMGDVELAETERRQWAEVVDRLLEWWQDPSQLADEGAAAPTRPLIELAIRVAKRMQSKDFSPPVRVVPTNDGGVCFERIAGDVAEALEVLPSGEGELRSFQGGRLFARKLVQLDGPASPGGTR